MPSTTRETRPEESAEMFDETMAREHSLAPEELNKALETITSFLRIHWASGGGRRLRWFVWSLWNGWHMLNLYHLRSGLDAELADAVITVFKAAILGDLKAAHLQAVLESSGELRRWTEASERTPEGEEVLYPPLYQEVDSLRRIYESALKQEARLEDERR